MLSQRRFLLAPGGGVQLGWRGDAAHVPHAQLCGAAAWYDGGAAQVADGLQARHAADLLGSARR